MNALKLFSIATLALVASLFAFSPHANATGNGFANTKFQKVFYFAHTATGSHSGYSSSNAHAIATDTTFWAIPLGTVIEKVYAILDVAVTGTSALSVGDTDSATSFIPTAAFTFATPGMYGWDAKAGGAYLRIQTAGATDAGDIYVVPNARYYSAAGKYLTITNTTTNTAGALRVFVEGYNVGS